jgi:transposase
MSHHPQNGRVAVQVNASGMHSAFGVAVTFVAEIGDLRRFDNPRQLMAFLGLVPSERSTGEEPTRTVSRSRAISAPTSR